MLTNLLKKAISVVQVPLYLITYSGLLAGFWPPHADVTSGQCYDYIVIGAGVGSVVANRLSENQNVSVLLIEYGEVPSIESVLPGLFLTLQESYQDWKYRSVEDFYTQSQSKDVYKVAAGKILGGSSAINHLVWLRGDPSDFNSWAETVNDSSWKYENILQYFLKSETVKDDDIMSSQYKEFHSTTGPLIISREVHQKALKFLDAFSEIGHNITVDLNGNITVGYAVPTISIGNNVRQSTAQAYMKNVSRSNLHVLYQTLATKINFDSNNTAVSVDILENGTKKTIRANKEIIVSAGVFGTPKLLMLSGIGPKEDLEKLNISVINDLPVGQNLQDHAGVQLLFQLNYSLEVPPIPVPTKLGLPNFVGAVNLNKSKTYPEYQTTNIYTSHDTVYVNLLCGQIFGYKGSICDGIQKNATGRNLLYSLIAKVNPNSKGVVKLTNTDASSNLTIIPNFYGNETDLDDMVKYVEDFIKIQNSSYFKNAKSELATPQFDNCTGDFDDPAYIRCYIPHMTTTLYHQTSTCAMGSVVDSKLKVYGTKRLRVVDASIFPKITIANPLASAVMVAEKASDMIKDDQENLDDMC